MYSIKLQVGLMMFAGLILSASIASADPAAGEALFKDKKKANCVTCHEVSDKKKVGPGLKGVATRRSEGWLRNFIQNPQGTWESSDPDTLALKKAVGKEDKKKTSMVVPKGLTDADIGNIIDYLKTL